MSDERSERVALGIDFGATNLKALIIDEDGNIRFRFIEPSTPELGVEPLLKRLVDLAVLVKQKAASAAMQLTGIGIGVCGPVDPSTGVLLESPVLPGWKNVPIGPAISDATSLSVRVENDASLAILGEWWQGAGERASVVAGLTLGTGIGGGLIINGQIYRGASGFGAEFGHISLSPEPPCPCGGRGCFGRLASATATLNRYKSLAGERAAAVKDVLRLGELARDGDAAAAESIAASADYIAKAVLIIVNLMNPGVFILAGGMGQLGDVLLDPIRTLVRSSTFKKVGDETRIVSGALGIYSGCYGAALLGLSETKALP